MPRAPIHMTSPCSELPCSQLSPPWTQHILGTRWCFSIITLWPTSSEWQATANKGFSWKYVEYMKYAIVLLVTGILSVGAPYDWRITNTINRSTNTTTEGFPVALKPHFPKSCVWETTGALCRCPFLMTFLTDPMNGSMIDEWRKWRKETIHSLRSQSFFSVEAFLSEVEKLQVC